LLRTGAADAGIGVSVLASILVASAFGDGAGAAGSSGLSAASASAGFKGFAIDGAPLAACAALAITAVVGASSGILAGGAGSAGFSDWSTEGIVAGRDAPLGALAMSIAIGTSEAIEPLIP
jgi:hypothetical protein